MAVNHGGNSVATYAYGEEFDLPDHEAKPLLEAGQVERAAGAEPEPESEPEKSAPIETATTRQDQKAERAVGRAGRKG